MLQMCSSQLCVLSPLTWKTKLPPSKSDKFKKRCSTAFFHSCVLNRWELTPGYPVVSVISTRSACIIPFMELEGLGYLVSSWILVGSDQSTCPEWLTHRRLYKSGFFWFQPHGARGAVDAVSSWRFLTAGIHTRLDQRLLLSAVFFHHS